MLIWNHKITTRHDCETTLSLARERTPLVHHNITDIALAEIQGADFLVMRAYIIIQLARREIKTGITQCRFQFLFGEICYLKQPLWVVQKFLD